MKHEKPVRQRWIIRAIETRNFHASRLKENPSWTITDTAKALCRSRGSICEDLLISSWLRTHETKLNTFKRAYEALEFIRDKKRSLSTDTFDL